MLCRVFPHPSGQEWMIPSSSWLSTVICLACVRPWCTAVALCHGTLTAAPPPPAGERRAVLMMTMIGQTHKKKRLTKQSHRHIRHAVLTITAPQRRTPPRHNTPGERRWSTVRQGPSAFRFAIHVHNVLPFTIHLLQKSHS